VSILFGHPTGSPFSHHAALAHWEAGHLDRFCVPWMPSTAMLRALEHIKPLQSMTKRLGRRHFAPLAQAPKIQGRANELLRLLMRASGRSNDRSSNDANDWLMRTMASECQHSAVTAVHAYEDCSLWQFVEAKRLGKACIYDLPIGYYFAWEQIQRELVRKYADWLPATTLQPQADRLEQKRREVELADLLLVPSNFVANTVRDYHPNQQVVVAPYGVDSVNWQPALARQPQDVITFLFAGQCSVRKGVPLLLEAWRAAHLKHARLLLVGPWQLAGNKKKQLPPECEWIGPVSSQELLGFFHNAEVFVFPTNFEGRALVVAEAMASGLPILTTPACGADDIIDETCGRIMATDNLDSLVENLRWFDRNRHCLSSLSSAARINAERCTWKYYRGCVTEAVASLV
jgi:glycosyltransferase involved in cell wall biosynthesis